MKKAVILFSGGLDSTTCLVYAKAQGYECHALSFDYGQRHAIELAAARRIAEDLQVSHHIFPLPLNQFGGSALTSPDIPVPENETLEGIPITYVPARNTIFLSIAMAYAEVLQAYDVFIGVSAVDYSGYPDCRPAFIEAFTTMARLAMKQTVEGTTPFHIHTPLIHLSKAETVALGYAYQAPYAMTVSCYQADASGRACGVCASCILRKKGFQNAGIADPTAYQ